MALDLYDYYTRLEPNHEVRVDEEGYQFVRCPFIDAETSWSPRAGEDEVGCEFCDALKNPERLTAPHGPDDGTPPISGGAHGGVHHVSEYQPCKVPNRRFELARSVFITAHEGVVASCGRIRDRYEDLDGYRKYPIRQNVTGAYVCRKTTSGSSWSKHAYGCAIDVNWDKNPYGRNLVTDMPRWFVDLWRNEGWGWGGDWNSVKDAMHFSRFPNEGGDGRLYVGTIPEEDDFMAALSDDEQRELLAKTRALHAAEFETTPKKVADKTPRGEIFSHTDQWIRLFDFLGIPWK